MKYLLTPGVRTASPWLLAAITTLLLPLSTGCASPGQPRPPSLNLPEPVKDLTAERIGNQAVLHWTTPDHTTDHLLVNGPISAEFCRLTPPATACTPIRQLPTVPGPATTSDTLPATLTTDPPTLVAYRVRILNASGHAAPPSNEALLATGIAPQTVAPLRAASTRDGVQLTWPAYTTPTATVQLDRLLLNPDGTPVLPAPKKPSTKPTPAPAPTPRSKSSKSAPARKTTQPTPNIVKLQPPTQTPDPGGLIDESVLRGETYQYTAQRIRTVTLDTHTLELRSALSSPVTLTMRDTFPPLTPTGLAAVPSGPDTSGQPASAASQPSIDLSWTPDADTDLAGYNIYRREVAPDGTSTASYTLLNPTPVPSPAYRDQTAIIGRRYAYHVTAVDNTGNQSRPSPDVQETLREP
jgi:hypothetical protein